MATQPPAGLTDEQLDELEGLTDEQLNASEASAGIIPAVGYLNRVGRGMAGEIGSQLSAVGQVVRHPINALTAAAKEALAGLASPASRSAELVSSLPGVAKGIAQQATTPEGQGALLVQGAEAAIPVGRIGASVARNVPLLRATEASRAYNIRRALRIPGGTSEKVQKLTADVNAMTPEIDLPVALRHRTLARKLTEARKAAGAEVGAAEAALPVSNIPVADVTRRIEMPPGQWASRNGVMEYVPDDPAAMAAYREAVGSLEASAGDVGTLSTPDLVRLKQSAQKTAREKKAYETAETTQAKGVARAKASAIRASLEDLTGPEAEALSAANRAAHVAKTIEKPAVAEATRLSNLPPLSRGAEILLGRAGGARTAGTVGAVGGLLGGQILDSTLFHTASAAAKRAVIDALQSGQPQLAADILIKSAVARRAAQSALDAQGEGVTTP